MRIRFYEWLAGNLIVRSARLRSRRGGPDDAHEVRHLFAALTAGNSSPCDIGGANCHLDGELLRRLHDSTFPQHGADTAATSPAPAPEGLEP